MTATIATSSDDVATSTACTHCSLPVPTALIESGSAEQYCCGACRIARHAIIESGLENYYALRDRLDASATRSSASGAKFDEFNDESFQRLHVSVRPDGLHTCDLFLEGVHCAACVWLVERLPRVNPGVTEARLDLGRSLVRVVWDPEHTKLSDAVRNLDRFGYRPHPATESAQRLARRDADRTALIRIGVAGACMGNVMLLAAALYSGMLDGIEETTRTAFRLISAAVGILAVAWPGRVFFRGALGAIRARAWHLDMPIALALGVGCVTGLVHAVRGTGEIYFDSVTMLVFLLLFGRWLQDRGVRAAADAVELLHALTPSVVHIVSDDGSVRDAPAAALEPGMIIEVRAGEPSPADGEVLVGESTVDASVLTGEPCPLPCTVGDTITAGSVNLTRDLRVRADAVGGESRLGLVMRRIETLSRERVPVLGRADQMAGPFVVTVSILAAICVAAWAPFGIEHAIEHATALLIVACPCALALATPLVTAVAVGRAARAGLLVKGADTFDRLARPGIVLLDKTGTVTEGRFELLDWHGDASLVADTAALERRAIHPIASTLAQLDDSCEADAIQHFAGSGVVGMVRGHRIAVGSRAFVESTIGIMPRECVARADRESASGQTTVFVRSDDGRSALAVLGDRVREASPDLIAALRQRGWRVGMVSGDRVESALAVGLSIGLSSDEIAGGVSPEGKLARVAEELGRGPVVMIGDGVNDAAALAKATVGIAVHGGAEASLAAADVYMTKPELERIVELFDGSRRSITAIKRCLVASLTYNTAAATLALAGLVTPLLAAVLMPASSLTVIGIALASRTFGRTARGEKA